MQIPYLQSLRYLVCWMNNKMIPTDIFSNFINTPFLWNTPETLHSVKSWFFSSREIDQPFYKHKCLCVHVFAFVHLCVEVHLHSYTRLIITALYAQKLWGHIDLTPWSISMELQQSTGLYWCLCVLVFVCSWGVSKRDEKDEPRVISPWNGPTCGVFAMMSVSVCARACSFVLTAPPTCLKC